MIHLIAPEQRSVARIGDLHLAQHLAHDDLDVLVVNFDALEAINFLHFVDQVFLQFLRSADFENFVRNDRTFGQLLAFLHEVALEDDDVLGERNEMLFLGNRFRIFQNEAALAADSSAHLDDAVDLRNLSRVFRADALRTIPPRAADRR